MSDIAKKPFQWRAFITFYVVLSFIVISLTGIVLFITPPGRIANWSDWRFLGFSKEQWQTIHTIFSFVFVLAASFHLYFNWKVILGYLAKRFRVGIKKRRELAASLSIGSLILILSAAGTPPFGTLMAWGEEIKNSWSTPQMEPPVPHAELLSLQKLANGLNLPVDELMVRFTKAGLSPDSAGMLVRDLAQKYSLSPREIYDRVGVHPDAPKARINEGGGFGRKTVSMVCVEVGITAEEGHARLRARRIESEAANSIRAVSQESGLAPVDIVAILQGTSTEEVQRKRASQ